jgi:error-prone DNA polymerase
VAVPGSGNLALVLAGHLGMSYAELVCASHFSFQRGASHPYELVERAQKLGYAALAITDECSLAGIVRAHDAAKDAGLKLIIGSQFRFPEEERIVLLAPNHAAYTQLCEFITQARRRSKKGSYVIYREAFASGLEHCIGLCMPGACVDESVIRWFAGLALARRYLAFTHGLAQDSERRLERLRKLGAQSALPLAAVGDVHYHLRERRPLHDVLTAIRLGTTVDQIGRAAFPNGERHLRPLATLRKLYPCELLAATLDIASECSFSLDALHYEYPEELVPKGVTALEHLRKLTLQGAARRWPAGTPSAVQEQIDKELALIAVLRYEHYFLTVEDMVSFARSKNILCQGRGSAANSAICYCLGVTAVDPARVSMLFERFVSKERAEPPDIDIDFEHERREEVIQYVYNKYGRHRTALAATVICYRRRMAVRDVGKALGLSLEVVNALSPSLQWFDGASQLPQELVKLGFDPQQVRVARQLVMLVNQLVGSPRHLSQHVGGFVISQHPLSTLVPIENAAMVDRTVIQWDKNDLESLGLLKVDCLALGMLTAVRRALDLVSLFRGRPFKMEDIPDGDPATYDMLCRGESVGVFQVESRAQMTMLPRLKPRCYYDLVIQVAIIRPGPIQGGMVHPYLRRRQGEEEVDYPSADLKKVLERTYGVPLFQEQVMEIAIVAAGFTPGEADLVRRSMAAWQRRGGLEQFRDKLLQGMHGRGYTPQFAAQIYQQILGFGSYGFPESHAASFALLAYTSSWLRCHEPAAFVAGLLNSWPMGFYAPAQLVNDARRNGVTFAPVDVHMSEWYCTLEPDAEGRPVVRIGLCMVSGLVAEQGRAIVSERAHGLFAGVDDLAHRASLTRRSLDVLARAGALNALAGHRRAAHWQAFGVERLPGALAGASAQEPGVILPQATEAQEIAADYAGLGLTLGRHPLALLRSRFDRLQVHRATDLQHLKSGRRVRVAGIVTHRQRPETASGVIFMSLEDETGISNLIVWPKIQTAQREAIFGARLIIVEGELQSASNVIHVIAQKVRDYSRWLGGLATQSRDFH